MYTASSVKEALNANTNLKIEGELGCPLEKIRNLNSNERRLSNCNAVCYGDYKNSPEGGIEEHNIALATLIKRNLINSKMLKVV